MTLLATNVRVNHGARVLLGGIDLRIEPGQCHALVGPNGAGKSTLLRILADSRSPQVSIGGRAVRTMGPALLARHRAVVGQHTALGFPFAVADVVALGRLPYGATRRDDAAVAQAMARLDVDSLAEQSYETLSGGERQRVHLARALAQLDGGPKPQFLLLDEPTASMDPAAVRTVVQVVRRVVQEGVGVLIVVHDLALAALLADTISLLAHGRVLASGSPESVLTPSHLSAAYGVPFVVHRVGAAWFVAPEPPPLESECR